MKSTKRHTHAFFMLPSVFGIIKRGFRFGLPPTGKIALGTTYLSTRFYGRNKNGLDLDNPTHEYKPLFPKS